jgi:hypothetical protein
MRVPEREARLRLTDSPFRWVPVRQSFKICDAPKLGGAGVIVTQSFVVGGNIELYMRL